MKYAVKKSDGTYDTTLYNESNQNIIDFHAERGEELVPVQGLDIEWDEEGEPVSVTPVELSKQQLQAELESGARQIAMEELIAERLPTVAMDAVRLRIESGEITDPRKALRDELKKTKDADIRN